MNRLERLVGPTGRPIRPEPVTTVARTVADVLDDHVTLRSPSPKTAAATSSARPATGSPPPAPAAAPAADPASSTPTSDASSSPATPTANRSALSPAPPRCPSAPSTTSSPAIAAAAPDHRWSAHIRPILGGCYGDPFLHPALLGPVRPAPRP